MSLKILNEWIYFFVCNYSRLEDSSQTTILLLHFLPTTPGNSLLHTGQLIRASNTAFEKYLKDFIPLSSVKHTSTSQSHIVSPCDCCVMSNQEFGTRITQSQIQKQE